jgi:hypothetical protein
MTKKELIALCIILNIDLSDFGYSFDLSLDDLSKPELKEVIKDYIDKD